MIHLDLFSGIGGFALAVDTVWPGTKHIFCDNDKFCQAVLKKHWPNSKIYGDIREITSDTESGKSGVKETGDRRKDIGGGDSEIITNSKCQRRWSDPQQKQAGWKEINYSSRKIDILTGGFPCQPFSQAGKRRGTADDRYLWPEMLRVIKETAPQWIIAENVGGLVTWNDGMVLEQVCSDLEMESYEVQPFIIPACAVNAPHRRDRVWIVANKWSTGLEKEGTEQQATGFRGADSDVADPRQQYGKLGNKQGMEADTIERTARPTNIKRQSKDDTDTPSEGPERNVGTRLQRNPQRLANNNERKGLNRQFGGNQCNEKPNWEANWLEVATELCGVDDGLPAEMDGFKLSKSAHRKERLKSLGNAIVPQVAIEIMRAIKLL